MDTKSPSESKEQQLAVSEKRLRAFFDNSQGLMCTHDLKGNFLSVNTAGATFLGYSPKEIVKMSLFDIVPVNRHPFLNGYLIEIKSKGASKGQMMTLHKDGSYRIWLYNNVLETQPGADDYVIGNAIDITERHLLELDLKRTKETLEQTSKVSRIGGWEFDVRQQKISWTSITKEIHGVDPDYIPDLKSGINFYKEGESRDKIKEALDITMRTGRAWDLELQIINAKGKEIWVRTMGNSESESGVCKRMYGTFQDIDEKKRTELEIGQSKKLLDDVLQAASEVSIIATDTNGIITVFNSGAEQLLGYPSEEMVGIQSPAILHSPDEVAKRGEELTKEFGYQVEGFRVFVEISEKEGSDRREWTYIKKDGSTCQVSLVITAIRDANELIIGYLGIATDISVRKEAEQALAIERSRLLAFVDHAPAAVAMFDKNIRYIAVSKRWVEEYKLEGKELIGKSHYEIFPNIGDNWKAIHSRCLSGKVERNDEDVWRPQGWDHDQYLRWEVRPWYQYDGSVGGIMMFTQDITQICLQRDELKKAKEVAEEASVAKSEFLANMSHEIRTPLNGVIGFTDLVLKTSLNETQQQYLTIVNQSANALLSIINDILDFSKIEAGKLELDFEKCDLYEVGCQATDIITYQVQTKGLEMLLNLSPLLPRYIWVDSVRLKQIIINLLGNAAKFTEKGEIELKIETLSSLDDQTTIRFTVRDTGIGIKPEKQGKIFEAFSQEDGSTTKKYGGTGLGLSISNKLLALMDSQLQLESVPGKGSKFYFDLTLKSEQGEAVIWENIDSVKKVLIADDNENNRMILNEILLLKKIQTVQVKNGLEALQVLAAGEQFDAVLMDYHMPYMDGLETIKKIRENFQSPEELPVILLHSSSEDEKLIKTCESLKIRHRLLKPIKMQDIYTVLSRLHKKEDNAGTIINTTEIEVTADSITVMIVEDNTVNMLLAKTIVKRIAPNASLLEAKNGLEAVDHCRRHFPDLIFMDIQMPEMNGYEATKQIRVMETQGHVPIIALTAGNVQSEKERCLAAGMDDFVVKPVIEETVSIVFNKWFNLGHQNLSIQPVDNHGEETLHFDKERIKLYIGDDESLINEIIILARTELVKSATELKACLNNKDLAGVNACGHKLYGTSVASGLTALSKLAYEMENVETLTGNESEILFREINNEIAIVLKLMLNPHQTTKE